MNAPTKTPDPRQGQAPTARTSAFHHTRDRELTVTEIWDMLGWIPADDRDTWIQIGMALHSALGGDGFSLWDQWSQSAGNYDAAAARNTWRSFKPGKVGAGTLVHLARQHGWRPDSDRRSPPPKPKPAPKPVARRTGVYARELWLAAAYDDDVVGAHPYARAKGIEWAAGAGRGIASGRVIGRRADCLVVPICSVATGKLQAVQCINAQGDKQTFGAVSGGCLLLGNTLEQHRFSWCVAEGWASAASMVFHHRGGDGVCAAAFGKSNMDRVAELIAEVYQPREIIILEEQDA